MLPPETDTSLIALATSNVVKIAPEKDERKHHLVGLLREKPCSHTAFLTRLTSQG